MWIKQCVLGIVVIIITSCSNEEREHSSFFETDQIGNKMDMRPHIEFDTIKINDIESSYTGRLEIFEDTLYFVDIRFGWIFQFDKDGGFISKKLGQGRGPAELNTGFVDGFSFLPDGRKIFIGSSLDMHLYDRNWRRIKQFVLKWRGNYDYTNISRVRNPAPSELSLYSFRYERLVLEEFNGKLYASITSEHTDFNPMTEDYYKEGRILAEIDLDKESVTRIMGRHSPKYLERKFVPQHTIVNFDIDEEGNFYVSHEIDPKIYVYDENFKIKNSLGFEGENMDINYPTLETFDVLRFRELYFNDRPRRGFYRGLKVFPEYNLILRSYSKGANSSYDGIQVYKDNNLIADFQAPKGFDVKGIIYPYVYSDVIIDEDIEEISIFRFKLPAP